jgi:hypothetical protein
VVWTGTEPTIDATTTIDVGAGGKGGNVGSARAGKTGLSAAKKQL